MNGNGVRELARRSRLGQMDRSRQNRKKAIEWSNLTLDPRLLALF